MSDDGVISGQLANAGLYRIDVVCNVGNSRKAVQLALCIVPEDGAYSEELMDIITYRDFDNEENQGGEDNGGGENNGGENNEGTKKKKGCFGGVASVSILTALLGAAGLAIISRKRKED